ncbi:MAG: phosphoribosylamine--glycine ligase [Planctomycetota bacterium]
MKILVVGSGGREHALAKAIARSPQLTRLYAAPGNPGIAALGECVEIAANDIDSLVRFVLRERIELTVVGPEEPLVKGLADRLLKEGLDVFGPSAEAAALEGSKVFCKGILRRYRIPTATYHVFDRAEEARDYVQSHSIFPIVVKADGLAAGKGVTVAASLDEALHAIEQMMVRRAFGEAGARILIEEHLKGIEASIHVVTDGRTLLPLEPAKDYKASYEGDVGPNTGGMGTYSPAPHVTPQLYRLVEKQILIPVVHAMNREGRPFRGLLYAGLMITPAGPKVLEFNVRFGDPEAQVLLPRLRTDIVEVLLATSKGQLAKLGALEFDARASVCVVLAARGYPGSYRKGFAITGVEEAEAMEDVDVYHAGTARDAEGRLVTAGGRVLGVMALGRDLMAAREKAYAAAEKIRFDGVRFRRDIALV